MVDGEVFGFGFFEGGEFEAVFLEEADELEFFFGFLVVTIAGVGVIAIFGMGADFLLWDE